MKRRTVFSVAGAGALGVATIPARAADAAEPRLKDAVTRANTEWLSAMKTGDAATIAAPYAEHGEFIFPDGSTIQGRDAVERMYRQRFEKRGVATSTTIDSKRLEADGDLAYEWGSATVGAVVDGKATVAGGRYLTVWQRQADGDWKIWRNLVF